MCQSRRYTLFWRPGIYWMSPCHRMFLVKKSKVTLDVCAVAPSWMNQAFCIFCVWFWKAGINLFLKMDRYRWEITVSFNTYGPNHSMFTLVYISTLGYCLLDPSLKHWSSPLRSIIILEYVSNTNLINLFLKLFTLLSVITSSGKLFRISTILCEKWNFLIFVR